LGGPAASEGALRLQASQDPTNGPPVDVVHSWALAPAGSTDPDAPGNRPTLSYETAPGATISDAVTLYNYSNVQLTFRLYATDAYNNEDGAFDLLAGDAQPTDVGSWVALEQENITLAPRSQATIPMTVTVPADAAPGDHAGAVLAASGTIGTGPDGKIVNLDRRTGSRIYLRVTGDLRPELAVEGLTTIYEPSFNPAGGTAEVTYRVRNRGNVRMSGTHAVSVHGPLGIGRHSVPTEDLPELLPGEDYTVHATLEGVPAGGLVFTDVDVQPRTVDGVEAGLDDVGGHGTAVAPPVTVLMTAIALWLALRARRAYRRHRADLVAEPVAM
ncbi:MAG: WxL protein peptidoglycan domain-containing protein, partial [Acidimicrobiales bacterium]